MDSDSITSLQTSEEREQIEDSGRERSAVGSIIDMYNNDVGKRSTINL